MCSSKINQNNVLILPGFMTLDLTPLTLATTFAGPQHLFFKKFGH